MSPPVLTIVEGMKVKNQNKTKIGVGSFLKTKVGELEETKRGGISKGTRKDVVGCLQAIVGRKNFPAQFKHRKKK